MDEFTVYYRKHYVDFYAGISEAVHNFWELYVPVMIMYASTLEEVFQKMQGEVWSPNGEAREGIKALGLSHTSMSVGDVLYSDNEDKYYMVKDFGWVEFSPLDSMAEL